MDIEPDIGFYRQSTDDSKESQILGIIVTFVI